MAHPALQRRQRSAVDGSKSKGPITDLRDVPAVVINMPDQRKRRRHMHRLLAALGIGHSFSDGVSSTEFKVLNATLAHQRAISAATTTPFMVLEDDLEFCAASTALPDLPADADIVYLGLNTAGCFPRDRKVHELIGHRSVTGFVLARAHDARFARLYSMVSAHAILFVTEAGVAAYAEALRLAVNRRLPLDVAYAYTMGHLKTYATLEPMFREDMALQPFTKRTADRAAMTATPLRLASIGERRIGLKSKWQIEAEVVDDGQGGLAWGLLRCDPRRA